MEKMKSFEITRVVERKVFGDNENEISRVEVKEADPIDWVNKEVEIIKRISKNR